MDVLDLSVGEKKSRRKTLIPQRRHVSQEPSLSVEGSAVDDVAENRPKTDTGACPRDLVAGFGMNSIQLYSRGMHNGSPMGGSDDGLMYRPTEDDLNVDRSSSMSPMVDDASKHSFMLKKEPEALSQRPGFDDAPKEQILGAGVMKNHPSNASLKNFCDRMGKRSFRSGFGEGKVKEDVQPMDTPGIPERTKKQNRWAFNVWREWARKRNFTNCGLNGEYKEVPLDVGKASETQLDHWLSKFVQEVRRKDGNPYPPHTLMQIVMGIQRYLRQQAGRPSICILDRSNPTYSSFRSVLDSRIKELTNNGVASSLKNSRKSGAHGPAANKSSVANSGPHYPDESSLWESGVMGFDTALGLLNAVFFHNTVSFGIRTIDDHWNLKMCHFEVGTVADQTYVEFTPSKDPLYVNRGLTQDRRIYAEPKNPRCAVSIFQKYLSLVPSDGAFYRHPQEPTLVDRSIRFSDQWIGKNRLRAMIKHIFDTTRLDGVSRQHNSNNNNNSNHHLRAGQMHWPAASPLLSLNSFSAPKQTPEHPPPGGNIYDRLAQAMLHLSRATKPAPFGVQFGEPHIEGENTPLGASPAALSPSSRLSDNEDLKGQSSSPCTPRDLMPYGNPMGNAVDRLDNEEPRGKRFRLNDDQHQHIELSRPASSSGHLAAAENVLEISVPRMITSVVITKGASRVTVDLD